MMWLLDYVSNDLFGLINASKIYSDINLCCFLSSDPCSIILRITVLMFSGHIPQLPHNMVEPIDILY